MDKSFAGLLRHSKLATYDRRLSQVYTTPKQYKQQGDWGLKRNLPSVIRTPYVTIGQLDSLEHQTPWVSGESQVVFIQRWKENFQHSFLLPKHYQQQQQQHYADQDYYNLATISKHEFHSFLKKTLTPEVIESLHNALETKKITREQVYDYLNITFRSEPHRIKGPIYYTSSSMENNEEGEEKKNKDIIVTGRILNAQKGGYAVGIGGVVAFLPKTLSMGLRKPGNRHLVHQFKVKEAYITDQGKPRVIVSFHRPSPSLSTSTKATNSIIEPSSSLEMNKEGISLPTISSSTFSLPTSSTSSLFNNINKKNNNNNNNKDPSSSSSSSWSSFSLDDLFSPAPPNNINDLHSFLIDQDLRKLKRKQIKKQHQQLQLDTNNTNHNNNSNNNNESSSSSSTSSFMNDQYLTSANELSEQHTVLMNRIVTLLKNGTVKK